MKKKYIFFVLFLLILINTVLFFVFKNKYYNKSIVDNSYYNKQNYIKYQKWTDSYNKLLLQCEQSRKEFLKNNIDIKRDKFIEILGINKVVPEFTSKIIEEFKTNNLLYKKIEFEFGNNFIFEVYLIIPDNNNGKGVLALHGTNWNIEIISGIKDHSWFSYGKLMAERGYIVIVPQLPLSGNNNYKEKLLYLTGIMCGRPIIGDWVDISRICLDYFEKHLNIKLEYGLIGWFLGGQIAYYTAAVDTRISAVSVINFLTTYKKLNLEMGESINNYIPNILKYFEFYDIVSLIYPRKLFFQAGEKDDNFPIDTALDAYKKIEKIYSENPKNLKLQIIPNGRHRPAGSMPLIWLDKNL